MLILQSLLLVLACKSKVALFHESPRDYVTTSAAHYFKQHPVPLNLNPKDLKSLVLRTFNPFEIGVEQLNSDFWAAFSLFIATVDQKHTLKKTLRHPYSGRLTLGFGPLFYQIPESTRREIVLALATLLSASRAYKWHMPVPSLMRQFASLENAPLTSIRSFNHTLQVAATLTSRGDFELVDLNKVFYKGKRTLAEADILLRDQRGRLHWVEVKSRLDLAHPRSMRQLNLLKRLQRQPNLIDIEITKFWIASMSSVTEKSKTAILARHDVTIISIENF